MRDTVPLREGSVLYRPVDAAAEGEDSAVSVVKGAAKGRFCPTVPAERADTPLGFATGR